MGLDAHVRCNCAKDGKTKPFPFPGRLAFDQSGEPFLSDNTGKAAKDLEELLVFDRWESNPGCEHEGFLVEVRIGNMSYVAFIRKWIETMQAETGRRFPVLLEKVVYNGIHGGDWLSGLDVQSLRGELAALESMIVDEDQRTFLCDMKRLCDASLASGNAIVF